MFKISNPRNKNDEGIIFDGDGNVYKKGFKENINLKAKWEKIIEKINSEIFRKEDFDIELR